MHICKSLFTKSFYLWSYFLRPEGLNKKTKQQPYKCLTSMLKAPINFSTFPAVIVSVYFDFTLAERSSDVAADRGRELPQAPLSTNCRALVGFSAPVHRGAGGGVCTVQLTLMSCFESLFWRLKSDWQSLAQNPAAKGSDFGSVMTLLCLGQFILTVPCQAPYTQRFLVNLRNQPRSSI